MWLLFFKAQLIAPSLRSYIMNKPVRLLTLVALLSLGVATTLSAENMGTNPKPKPQPKQPSVLEVLQYTVLSYLGL
jgi:hypothetical protein